MELAGLPLLIARDRHGQVRAFLNVCRHRGARLVNEESGCKHTLSCPYHAWTWSNTGDLRGVPHQQQGFPDLDKSAHALAQVTCAERSGWIWVAPDAEAVADIDAQLAPLAGDLAWLDMEGLRVARTESITCAANWKLLVEGGLEAYHFKVAHAATIGPYFPDNLSSYARFGRHLRSVLPRVTLADLPDTPRDQWDIRRHANLLYTLFPGSQFLVQQDHVVWVRLDPRGPAETEIRLTTMAPDPVGEKTADHWARNHAITRKTLGEDFAIGEAIQAGLASGANTHLTFGRFEGALEIFASTVRQALAEAK